MGERAEVHLDVQESIAVITFDNPPVNVLNSDVWQQLRTALLQMQSRSDIAAVVLTGSGQRAFIAGADIKEFPALLEADNVHAMAMMFHEILQVLHHLPQPTLAVLNGLTLGGGCEVALACDFRVAEEHAQIGFPEIKLGVFPGAGGTQRLPRLIGEARAKELIFTGEFVTAERAYEIGLVNRVVPTGEGLAAALAFCRPFATGSRVALAHAKRAMDDGGDGGLDEGLGQEARLFADVFATTDAREGIYAFIEKRRPTFSR